MTAKELIELMMKQTTALVEPSVAVMPPSVFDAVQRRLNTNHIAIMDQRTCDRCGVDEGCYHEAWCAQQHLARAPFRHVDDDVVFNEWERERAGSMWRGIAPSRLDPQLSKTLDDMNTRIAGVLGVEFVLPPASFKAPPSDDRVEALRYSMGVTAARFQLFTPGTLLGMKDL